MGRTAFTSRIKSGFLPLLIGLMLVSMAHPSTADTFKQLNVIVNQLSDAAVPNTADRQKEMNDILKQCDAHGVKLRVTISKVNENQDPKDKDGNSIAPNGEIPNDRAANELDKKAMESEIKDGGFKVWLAKGVKSGGRDVNGSAAVGTPCMCVREQSGIDGDAQTWVHEMAHGLGLRHVADTDNIMYRSRRKPNGDPRGSGLTKAQCETILEHANKRNPSTEKTEEQKEEPPAQSRSTTMINPEVSPDVENTSVDLPYATVVFDHFMSDPFMPALHFQLHVNTPPDNTTTTDYQMWLDLDNDPSTGNPDGYDAVVNIYLSDGSGGNVTFFDPGSDPFWPWPPFQFSAGDREVSGDTFGDEEAYQTVWSGSIPIEILPMPLHGDIRVMFTAFSEDSDLFGTLGPETVGSIPLPQPFLQVEPRITVPGEPVFVVGMNYTPNSQYVVLFDDIVMAQGMTTPLGGLQAVFTIPDCHPNDYLVDAIDNEGLVQIGIIRTTNGIDTIGQALEQPDGTHVGLAAKGVTSYFPGEIGWIQEANRSAGIQFVADANVESGQNVTLFGEMSTLGATRQLLVNSIGVNPTWHDIAPVAMNNRTIGGGDRNPHTPGVTGGTGLNNVGMLVTTTGIVTASGPGFFYINDGSGVQDGSGNTGVRVFAAGLETPTVGQYAIVTGTVIAAKFAPNDPTNLRLLVPRDSSDIQVLGGEVIVTGEAKKQAAFTASVAKAITEE